MISPAEIIQACQKKWGEVLRAALAGLRPPGAPGFAGGSNQAAGPAGSAGSGAEAGPGLGPEADSQAGSAPLFPMYLPRIGKVQTKDLLTNLEAYRKQIEQLRKQSKQVRGYGYTIAWQERLFDKIGLNTVPDAIFVETLDDYLELTGCRSAYEAFELNARLVIASIPSLYSWVGVNLLKLIEHTHWVETLRVCQYFLSNPAPDLYIRQLPINVHTKYIRENEGLIKSLLDFLIGDRTNLTETRFEKRYNLRYAEPLVRIRFLDAELSPLKGISDLSVPLGEFSQLACPANTVFITENLMNFLTLPTLAGTVAIWSGGGFNIAHLKEFNQLRTANLIYWGDIDSHGFQILSQCRTYFPQTQSVMMDQRTLTAFSTPDDLPGPKVTAQQLLNLTASENELYQHVCATQHRLEQEKITQVFAEVEIRRMIET